MTFYHGSPTAELTELKPILSEHGKPYVYFSTNPLVALLYAVKPVPKPFSWYPYGFDCKGNVVYCEYFENAFEKLYNDKVGYLYECDDISNAEKTTQINCAYTCDKNVKIDRVTKITNLYQYFKKQEKAGLFTIKRINEISEKEMTYVLDDLKATINKYHLAELPKNPMTIFIRQNFSKLHF